MAYTSVTTSKVSGGISITYSGANGNTETRSGGSRSWRNNNPGNLEYGDYAISKGAIGTDGRFAIFPDVESGTKAKEDLLKGKYINYESVLDMLKKYAPYPENDPVRYSELIRKLTGIDVNNKRLSDFSAEEWKKLVDAMRRCEGYIPGKINGKIAFDNNVKPLNAGSGYYNKYLLGYDHFFVNSNIFYNAKTVPPPRRDPLVFDLDGDGIETVAVGAGVLFDHNADGIATGTGWVKPDDGLLVRDIDSNGTIDSGRELFGDRTLLSSGAQATDGYAALRDLDSNADGKIGSSDAAFSELKIWRDLNQDGISQVDELTTLADAGISAINLDAVAHNQAQNGNTIASAGTYTKTDGTTGATADVNLASDPSIRRFTDIIDIPETVIYLPDMTGSGKVRDLHEAAALSTSLQDALTRFTNAATRAEQLTLLDELLLAWADTSGMAGSLDERDPCYRVEYLSFGNVRRSDHITGTATAGTVTAAPTNVTNPLIDAGYRNLISQWNNKVHILEAFNGSYFFGLPGQPQDGGAAAIGIQVDYSGSTALSGANKGKPGLAISFDQRQLDLLQSAYQSLRQSVYDSLILQTRLKSYLDKIDLSISETTIALDFTQLIQSLQDKLATDPVNGLIDLIEFNRYTKELLAGTQWDGVGMMEGIGCADGYFSHSGKRRLAA